MKSVLSIFINILYPSYFTSLSFPSFSLPDVLCDPTDLIWMEGTPFEAMTGRIATSSDGLLAEVFLSSKANARFVHSPWDHFIITIIISDRRDTWGKWPLARNLDRSWWHRHTSLKFFWPQPIAPWTTDLPIHFGYKFRSTIRSPIFLV